MNSGRRQFPTTAWSDVLAAQDADSPQRWDAINRCLAGYWRPVFYFLRAKGCSHHQAEDLTQEFFTQFFQRDWIRRADRGRGRFRTFLLTILTRFVSDQGPRAPKQQQFDNRLVCISALMGDDERSFEPAAGQTPEQIFMQRWAQAVVDTVSKGVEAWCQDRGRPDWYQIFRASHFPPSGSRVSQQALAAQFHVSRDQVRYGLEEVSRKFVELLRAEVSQQVTCTDDLEQELHELQRLVAP
jgi:RNA polymerase sigma-70 factor (ECF subfamily)